MNLTGQALFDRILKQIPYEPTPGQAEAVRRISNFIEKSDTGDTYLLKGYAGTGKTTIISALVRALPSTGTKTLLMAPTGRAAKVMSSYSGKPAYTIHRRIYRQGAREGSYVSYSLAPNPNSNTLIIVDEASMISDQQGVEGRNLLADLIAYVKSGSKCRLLLIGDNAQLPPVGQPDSPALNIRLLTGAYRLRAGHFELTEVVRQEKDSGILSNATALRNDIRENKKVPAFDVGYNDFVKVDAQILGEVLTESYSTYGPDDVIVICRSNKSAIRYNRQIRYSGLWFEEEICAGDYLMCVKNNYFWLDDSSPAGFIANGDILKISRIHSFEEKFGFRFADISVEMFDYPDQPAMELKIILDSLHTEAPALTKTQYSELYRQVQLSYPDITSKTAMNIAVAKDPWFNALQVKFSYAVTCHKAQGGQWKIVFVDQGYLTPEMENIEFLRWVYTAITRATEKIYLVNFNENYFTH